MQIKYITIILFLIIALGLIWRSYNKVEKQEQIESTYFEVQAVVKSVRRSGVRAQLSTLLTVSYSYNGKDYSATLKKGGYGEGNYKPGDSVVICIDPKNPATPIDKVRLKLFNAKDHE